MRLIRSILVFVLLVAATCCNAESLQVTTTPATVKTRAGAPVAMAVSLKNTLVVRDPITLTAEAEWEDEYGTARTATASATITVLQPIKVNRYKVAIPALFAFVAGSAKVNGQPAAPAPDTGRLVFELGQTIAEGESVTLEYSLKAQ